MPKSLCLRLVELFSGQYLPEKNKNSPNVYRLSTTLHLVSDAKLQLLKFGYLQFQGNFVVDLRLVFGNSSLACLTELCSFLPNNADESLLSCFLVTL